MEVAMKNSNFCPTIRDWGSNLIGGPVTNALPSPSASPPFSQLDDFSWTHRMLFVSNNFFLDKSFVTLLLKSLPLASFTYFDRKWFRLDNI